MSEVDRLKAENEIRYQDYMEVCREVDALNVAITERDELLRECVAAIEVLAILAARIDAAIGVSKE